VSEGGPELMALLSPHCFGALRLDPSVRLSHALFLAALPDAPHIVVDTTRRRSIRRLPASIFGAGAGEAAHYFGPRAPRMQRKAQ